MFKQILVPLDGSALAALNFAESGRISKVG